MHPEAATAPRLRGVVFDMDGTLVAQAIDFAPSVAKSACPSARRCSKR